MARSWVMVESCDRDHDCRRWEYCAFRDQRVLDPGSYVLIEKGDGGWPDWSLKISSGTDIRSILDALAGGEQP